MKSNNVVTFPKENIQIQQPTTVEKVDENISSLKQYHVQQTISNIAPILFNQLAVAGFDVDDETEDDLKNGAFIIESLRAYMHKYYNIYHPFQDLAGVVFECDRDDRSLLKIQDHVNIKFRKLNRSV